VFVESLYLWLLVLGFITIYSIIKKDGPSLLIASLIFLAFSWVLTFEGLDIIHGFNKSTGDYVYYKILPANDHLFLMFGIAGFSTGFALFFFSLYLLIRDIIRLYKQGYVS
jgi:hypothetical protein